MASLSAAKTKQSFLQKGFQKKEGDHHFYLFFHNNKLVAKTKMSHNDQEIGDGLISKMYKQCLMGSKNFFVEFAKCDRSKEDYLEVLRSNGHI
jgi:hypothetical protein